MFFRIRRYFRSLMFASRRPRGSTPAATDASCEVMLRYCPICGGTVQANPRYPRYVCSSCRQRASSPEGEFLEFFNQTIFDGYLARYVETGLDYPRHDCVIDGVKCRADEARFGGIVIQPC